MSQKVLIIANAKEIDITPDFLVFYRLPGRRISETVAFDSLSKKGCRQAHLIAKALNDFEDITSIHKVVTIEPPHNAIETFRSPGPFLTAFPFIHHNNIKDVEQKKNLTHFPIISSLPPDHKSMLIVSNLAGIWGNDLENENPSSNSLLGQINILGYTFSRQNFFPKEGITLYLYDVTSHEITVWHRKHKEYVLDTIQPEIA